MFALGFICFNTVSYTLHRALLLKSELRPSAFFSVIFLFLSLPCGFVFGLVDHRIQDRMYKRRCHDLRKILVICDINRPPISDMKSVHRIPPDYLIREWELDCHMFVDEFGDFDFYAWRHHEFEKLGL